MTITRLHMYVTVLIALALHGGVALWLALPAPHPLPPLSPLPVNLLAIAPDAAMNDAAITPSEPPSQPVSEPTPEPAPVAAQPKPKPQPVVQEASVEPQPVLKPMPVPQPPIPRMVNNAPEYEQLPKPIQERVQPTPAATSLAPLDAAATARYEQLLVAWLEKHKKYPRRAKRLRIEGDGMLRILINREGQTQQVTLEQPTGNRLLDKAALEMAQRADPFPPMSENDLRLELEFLVPVSFVLH